MSKAAGPSSNWAKLQETLSSSPTARSRNGKAPMPHSAKSAKSKARKKSGIAAYLPPPDPNAPGPSTVKIPVPAPVTEGVVLKPLAEPTAAQIELREMVAGRTAMTESRKAIAIDCEMVGLGHLGSESSLARVSLVNYHGHVLLDTFVAPRERVTDWRTWVSGIREEDLIGAPGFSEVQKKVAELVDGRILIGHAIENDLKALLLNHPGPMVRDTQKCKALREKAKNKRPGLKKLAELELGLEIQKGAHSSVTDARATMALYRLHRVEWEKSLRPLTEAFKTKTKRKRDDDKEGGEEDNDWAKKRKDAGGRKGVSTGLGKIVRKNGVRVDHRTGRVLDGKDKGRVGGDADAGGGTGGSGAGVSWWEDDA